MGECKHESKQKIGTSSIFIHMPLFLVCRCKVHPVQTSETEGIVWQVHFWEWTYFTFFNIRHAPRFPNFLTTIDPPTKQLQRVCPPSSNAQHSHLRQEDAKKSRSRTSPLHEVMVKKKQFSEKKGVQVHRPLVKWRSFWRILQRSLAACYWKGNDPHDLHKAPTKNSTV